MDEIKQSGIPKIIQVSNIAAIVLTVASVFPVAIYVLDVLEHGRPGTVPFGRSLETSMMALGGGFAFWAVGTIISLFWRICRALEQGGSKMIDAIESPRLPACDQSTPPSH